MVKKLKPERFLTVKKLTEEEEFKPKVKKTPLDSREYQAMLHQFHQKQAHNSSIPSGQSELKKLMKPGVEIVGLANGKMKNQQSLELDEPTVEDDMFYLNSSRAEQLEPKARATLVPHKKTYKPILRMDDNSLNDKSYLQIIDNLTYRYNITTTNNGSNSNGGKSSSSSAYGSGVGAGVGGSGGASTSSMTAAAADSKEKSKKRKLILVISWYLFE